MTEEEEEEEEGTKKKEEKKKEKKEEEDYNNNDNNNKSNNQSIHIHIQYRFVASCQNHFFSHENISHDDSLQHLKLHNGLAFFPVFTLA